MAKKDATADQGEQETTEPKKPKGIRSLPPMRLKKEASNHDPGLMTTPEGEEIEKQAARRSMALAEKVQKLDIPQSMKHHILIQNVDDETVDQMAKDWKEDRIVRNNGVQWGEEKPKGQ